MSRLAGDIQRGTVRSITTAGVFVSLDGLDIRDYAAGPILIPPTLALVPPLAVGDRVIVACIGGSPDDLLLMHRLG